MKKRVAEIVRNTARNTLDVFTYAFGVKQGLERSRRDGLKAGILEGFLSALSPALSYQEETLLKKTKILPQPAGDSARILYLGVTPDLITRIVAISSISGNVEPAVGLGICVLENFSVGLAAKIDEKRTARRNTVT